MKIGARKVKEDIFSCNSFINIYNSLPLIYGRLAAFEAVTLADRDSPGPKPKIPPYPHHHATRSKKSENENKARK